MIFQYFYTFSMSIAESWLCDILKCVLLLPKNGNDFWWYCAVARMRGNSFHRSLFIIFIAIVFAPDIEGVQNKVICL